MLLQNNYSYNYFSRYIEYTQDKLHVFEEPIMIQLILLLTNVSFAQEL